MIARKDRNRKLEYIVEFIASASIDKRRALETLILSLGKLLLEPKAFAFTSSDTARLILVLC